MNPLVLILLPLIGGVLSWLAWPDSPLFFLIFFAWVPLLFVEDYFSKKYEAPSKLRLFPLAYLFFFTWNILTTWWLWYASEGGAITAIVVNSFLMCIPILLFHQSKKKFGARTGYFSLIVFWLSFEHLHMAWELAWPWLNLGNVFAYYPAFVQWYAYTGSSGGTLWVLLFNILLFTEAKKWANNPPNIQGFGDVVATFGRLVGKPVLLLLVPLAISLLLYNAYEEKGEAVEMIVVQPNFDPHTKFQKNKRRDYMNIFMELSREQLTDSTTYIVWPETAIPHYIHLDKWESYESIKLIENMLRAYPKVSLVTGASTLHNFKEGEKLSKTARKYRRKEGHYDSFNSALQFGHLKEKQLYHKSKLVPGAERMPYAYIMKYIERFMVDLGGIGGSLGVQEERAVFQKNDLKIAPVICYESVFGEYLTDFIKEGANFIFIVTNDAWWLNTKGHRHHLHYASLRAIETRRSIARSANTGVSCFIDQRGDIHQATTYGTRLSIKGKIQANEEITFFVRWGDLLSRISLAVAIFLLLNLIVSAFTNNFRMASVKRKV